MSRCKQTHCHCGHEFTADNVRLSKLNNGYTVRKCKECKRAYDKMRYRKCKMGLWPRQSSVIVRTVT